MSNETKILNLISEKLGLTDAAIVQKGEEFFRVLQNKGTFKNLNDIARAVLCFDLAALQLGASFDKETAFKLAGLKKSAYQNNLHNVEKLLNLDKPLTVSELCVQFSCTVVKKSAENLLEKYKEKHATTNDYTHPLYVAVSVYTACKLQQIKVQKPNFISVSRLKPSQWKELESEFMKFAESIGITTEKRGKKKKENEFIKHMEEIANAKDTQVSKSPKMKDAEEALEDYETWKDRILQEARHALENKED